MKGSRRSKGKKKPLRLKKQKPKKVAKRKKRKPSRLTFQNIPPQQPKRRSFTAKGKKKRKYKPRRGITGIKYLPTGDTPAQALRYMHEWLSNTRDCIKSHDMNAKIIRLKQNPDMSIDGQLDVITNKKDSDSALIEIEECWDTSDHPGERSQYYYMQLVWIASPTKKFSGDKTPEWRNRGKGVYATYWYHFGPTPENKTAGSLRCFNRAKTLLELIKDDWGLNKIESLKLRIHYSPDDISPNKWGKRRKFNKVIDEDEEVE